MKRSATAILAIGSTAAMLCAAAPAQARHRDPQLQARNDRYATVAGKSVTARVFANDTGHPTAVVSHTAPSHGSLTLSADGALRYVPAAGFTGTDSFTYTASDAVSLYKTDLPPLATIGGVKITGGAYGSSLTAVPGHKNEVYGLTDRGPNVDGPDGTKIEPIPTFDPAIGKFRLVNGRAVLEKKIPLRAGDGTPYNGLVNSQASTGETITDLSGTVLPTSPYGYDSEGLVALRDGTFWVSDEYGPFITHFDSRGRAIGRLSPFDASLPAELAQRVPNKGMEGLTITPDGRTLVGVMQSALQTPDLTAKPANVAPLRIVTYDLRTHVTHEYLYLLTDPKINSGAVSEITALSNHTFVVDERDGKFEPNAYKKLFTIDLSHATDVGPRSRVAGSKYSPSAGGLLVGAKQQSIEALVGTDNTAKATADLVTVGITAATKTLDVDLGGLLTRLDPSGGFFGHDKVEGVSTTDGGRTLIVSNDNDFGISAIANTAAPFQLAPKELPDGSQDDGEYLKIDTTKIDDVTSTATVTIRVLAAHRHH